MKIFKYPLKVVDCQEIELPHDYQLLTVQMQGGKPQLWARVTPDRPTVKLKIWTVGTGHEFNIKAEYVGTYQLHKGALVFHVFAEGVKVGSS